MTTPLKLLGDGFVRQFVVLQFSFVAVRAKTNFSVKYETSVANDFLNREVQIGVSGSAFGVGAPATEAALDTFLTNLSIPANITIRSEFVPLQEGFARTDIYREFGQQTVNAKFFVADFGLTEFYPELTLAQIVLRVRSFQHNLTDESVTGNIAA